MSDPNLRRDDNSSPSATGKRNEAPQSAAPNMGARSASPGAMERRPPDLEAARNFRQLSQAERLRDDGMKAGAKMVAAIDAAIDRKYGPATLAADKMKRAARESVAQTLERGGRIAVPRAREADQQKEASVEQARTSQNDRAIDR